MINGENNHPVSVVDSQSTGSNRQFTLLTVLLLTAAIASWLGYFNARESRRRDQHDVQSLQLLARELEITHPSQYAAAMQLETYVGESIWNVYLPPGHTYQLKLALESLPTPFGATEAAFPSINSSQQIQLRSGKQKIELKVVRQKEGATIQVLVDGVLSLDLKRDAQWSQSSSSGSSGISMPKQQEINKPLILRHHTVTTPPAPASENGARGELLWIEKSAD